MKYPITIFQSLKTNGKTPISPFNDKTFSFETIFISEDQLLRTLVNNYILNLPLEIDKPIRTYRRKSNLKDYYYKNVSYFIVDFDKILTLENMKKVLDYCKKYKCIVMESRSHNGVDCFNLKGIVFCNLKFEEVKFALLTFLNDLSDVTDVDQKPAQYVSLNAPTGKYNVLLDNLSNDKILEFSDITVCHKVKKNQTFAIKKIDDVEHAESISDLCLTVFQNLGFTAIQSNDDGSVSFKHPSEIKTPGGFFWYRNSPFIMHHFNASKNVNIFNEVKALPIFKELSKHKIDYDKKLQFDYKNFNTIQVEKKFLEINDSISNKINDFLMQNDGVFAIKSPMGTGKSIIISEIINEAQEQDLKVLIITNRISVAEDFAKKYHLKIYNKDKYQIGDSLICQFDSLWKYNIKYFDIVILDEFISLLLHSRNTINNSPINISKFFASFNKKLVIADAFLTGYELKYLFCKKENLYLLDNQYRDDVDILKYQDFNYFVLNILECAKKENITVSSTSLNFIKALQLLLDKYNIKTITLTSETPLESRELIYKEFEKSNNDKWTCLLFSPTLTVGVSNMNNISSHFHYDSSLTTDVISSIQMLKRTRKANKIHLYIKNRINFLKTNEDELLDDYISSVGKSAENNFLFEMNDYGEPKLSKLGKKIILIDVFKNIIESNHREALLWYLKCHFKKEPLNIEQTFSSNILLKYQKIVNENANALLESNTKQFLSLNNFEIDYLNVDQKSIDYIMEINKCIITDDDNIRKEIFNIAIKDKSFIKKCTFFKILYDFSNGFITKDFINNKISSLIMKNDNYELLQFYTKVLQIDQKIAFAYIGKIDFKLKKILIQCGYKVYNDEISELGIRKFECNRDVKKYYMYLKY